MQTQHRFIQKPQPRGTETVTVEIGPQVDFVYIVRTDEEFTVEPLAQELAAAYEVEQEAVKQTLLEEYALFINKLAESFYWGFSQKGTFELHLYNPDELDAAVRQKVAHMPAVSLDPLISHSVYNMTVSRAYYLGGKKDTGPIARPGTSPLDAQAQHIAESLAGKPVCVVEDDVFSGGSITASLDELIKRGVTIHKVIPGIQVGTPDKLTKTGIPVDPVVRYKTTDGTDIFDRVDLGDPRDYLVGASGLVVHLPGGAYGRAPYILPFVSTTARSSMPAQAEREFALNVLQANMDFFLAVEGKLGKPFLLEHMNQHFMTMMCDLYGFEYDTPMTHIVAWAVENLDTIWQGTQRLGEIQEQLATIPPELATSLADEIRQTLDHLVEQLGLRTK